VRSHSKRAHNRAAIAPNTFMTARVSSINGITKLHTFEFEFNDLVWKFNRASAVAEASTLGFKPGEWPDRFVMRPLGMFVLVNIQADGSHVYSDESNHLFTILND
jgi:hypothetical protein